MSPASSSFVALRRALLRWYRQNARDLPWRQTTDPYCIWLSEIMLQQTRVETVIDYYHRFLEAFPTVQDLADAPADQVMKRWEGLGYYSRARNLHKAAQTICQEHGGAFPRSVEGWMALPGVGRYTAGAIASIAFGVKAPVVDGNVKRVLSRLFFIETPLERSETTQAMWEHATALLPQKNAGDFNQAMMELGARICRSKEPLCGQCPVARYCRAYQLGRTHETPVRMPKKTVPHVLVVAAAIENRGRFLLGRRPPEGMLGGLWEFPGGKVDAGESLEDALKRELREELGIETDIEAWIGSVDHAYTHLRVTLHLFRCRVAAGKPQPLFHSELKWAPRAHFDRYAFPKANLKLLPLV